MSLPFELLRILERVINHKIHFHILGVVVGFGVLVILDVRDTRECRVKNLGNKSDS